jgi:hypothetical protein
MRIEGWEAALAAEIERARAIPFQWGIHDCAIWAFDVRRALTGEDAAKAWRGRYGTALGAYRELRRMGWASHVDGATAIMGAALATPLLAQRGDIVLSGDAFGICLGAQAVFLATAGLIYLQTSECQVAWRV